MKIKSILTRISSVGTVGGFFARAAMQGTNYFFTGGDFQIKVMKPLMEYVINKTTCGMDYSGFENISKEKSYIFVSNHCLIIDSAFFNLAMHYNGFRTTYSVIGENLMKNRFAAEVFGRNKCMTIKRSGGYRAGKDAVDISFKIAEKIDSGNSVWIAQSRGRAKDGDYVTDSSIAKMLLIGNSGNAFVPVAVSYEIDPNDVYKARISEKQILKGRYDDAKSIIRELFGVKGRVRVSLGIPFSTDNPDFLKQEIDRQIALNYAIWPTNETAFKVLESGNLDLLKGNMLEDRLERLSPELMQRVMQFYARPVFNLNSYLQI